MFKALVVPVGLFAVLAVLAQTTAAASEQAVRTLSLTAEEAFEKGMGGSHVQRNDEGQGIVLYDTTLIEDDGPGAGSNALFLVDEDRSPVEEVNADTRLKKVLYVEQPEAREAILYIRPGQVDVAVNGEPVEKRRGSKFLPVPVALLRKGENEVVLSAQGDARATIKVAARKHILQNAPDRKDRAPRSFRSTDGGKTWEPIDGELTIRLHLRQYVEQGSFISPVMDAGQPGPDRLSFAKASIQSVGLTHEADTPPGTRVEFAVRTGSGPVYESSTWADWRSPESVAPEGHRFLQWQAVLKTSDLKVTPVLKNVTVEAKVNLEPRSTWADKVVVKTFHNEEIRYTSMPFEYEDPQHPRMVALRQKYKLDEVVKDGKTEFEKLVRLRDWVSHQWKFTAPEKRYPAWDADEILQRKIGMCVQYAITYMQCATSLGHQARFVFGYHPGTMRTAHEVCEVWSNDYGKWVYMDPNRNQHYVDPETNEPLSMLETHDRMVRTYYGDGPATYSNRPRKPKHSEEIAICNRLEMVPSEAEKPKDAPPRNWISWTKWLLVSYVPRNNFYAQQYPVPRIQGWNSYDWTGYWAWYDGQTPRDWRYSRFTSRRSDLHWTINQVCFAATYGEEPGTLTIQMGTVTPYFETFLVRVDDKGWTEQGRRFAWKLHPGRNRVEMRVRNTAGIEGPVSYLDLTYEQ